MNKYQRVKFLYDDIIRKIKKKTSKYVVRYNFNLNNLK